jgi:hypothetical protein
MLVLPDDDVANNNGVTSVFVFSQLSRSFLCFGIRSRQAEQARARAAPDNNLCVWNVAPPAPSSACPCPAGTLCSSTSRQGAAPRLLRRGRERGRCCCCFMLSTPNTGFCSRSRHLSDAGRRLADAVACDTGLPPQSRCLLCECLVLWTFRDCRVRFNL